MKKEVYFKVGGYDSQFLIFEDWDLKIRLAEKFKFYYTGLSGIAYRRHKGGLSQAPIGVQIKWMKEIFKKNIILSKPVNQKLLIISFETYINNVIKANKPGLVSIR